MKIFISIIFIIAFSGVAFSQKTDNFTYKDLLNQQKTERDELKQTQKEILETIIARQKEEFSSIPKSDNGYELGSFRDKHNSERLEIINRLTIEREKQMQLQATERKEFLDRSKITSK